MIELRNVSKIYNMPAETFYAVRNVSIRIEDGELLAIRGTSGAGKTTLLNILGLVDRFDTGEYFLDGISVSTLKDKKLSGLRNSKIGFVFQDFALLNDQKVLYNVILPLLYNKRYSYKQALAKAEQTLDLLGILDQKNKYVRQLSGGQKQRAAIARAIINDPSVVLADEPTGALDSRTTEQILDCLEEIHKNGSTVIIVTHDEKVAAHCNREILMEDGEIRSDH